MIVMSIAVITGTTLTAGNTIEAADMIVMPGIITVMTGVIITGTELHIWTGTCMSGLIAVIIKGGNPLFRRRFWLVVVVRGT